MLQWPLGDHVSQVPSQLGYKRVTPGLGHVSDSTIQTQSGYLNCVVLSHSMSDKTPVRYNHLKMSSAKCQSICLNHNVLTAYTTFNILIINAALLVLCEGNPLVTSGFPSQRASNAESVSMLWHHHVGVTVSSSSWTKTWLPMAPFTNMV